MDYDQKALLFAEKYGVVEYEVHGQFMHYIERFPAETYECVVDLETMKEIRKQVK